MATGDGIIVKLTNLEPIEGADNIVKATLYGETIVVSKDEKEGTLGILFDIETCLSPEYLKKNNLYRHEELNADPTKKGYFENSGRVRPIKLKGVKVSGFFMPVESLAYTGVTKFKEGTLINELNGHKICAKYMPPVKYVGSGKAIKKALFATMFKEHFSTDHLLKSLHDVPVGPFVITTKLHGTSGRYGKVIEDRQLTWWERWFNVVRPPQWKNAVGSRTVVKSIGQVAKTDKHYYDSDIWTKACEERFGDKLLKGETVYFEIVGYVGDKPIMPSSSIGKLKPLVEKDEYKRLVECYGDTVHYHYGCKPGEYEIYIYRITHTTVDGYSIDLPWEAVKQRSEKLGIPHVPELTTGRKIDKALYAFDDDNYNPILYTDDRDFSDAIDDFADQAAYNKTFPEGICLRSEMYPTCKIWKHKSKLFKYLEFEQRSEGITTQDEIN